MKGSHEDKQQGHFHISPSGKRCILAGSSGRPDWNTGPQEKDDSPDNAGSRLYCSQSGSRDGFLNIRILLRSLSTSKVSESKWKGVADVLFDTMRWRETAAPFIFEVLFIPIYVNIWVIERKKEIVHLDLEPYLHYPTVRQRIRYRFQPGIAMGLSPWRSHLIQ